MADNTTLDAGTGGDIIATASLSFSGDTAKVQAIGVGLLSGSEGSWTYSLLVGGAGAVAAGVQRVTLASDDPAVTSLQLIDDVVFAEDAAATTGDKGVQVLAVRRDSAAVSSGTDGDYSTLNVDANGRLYVACDTHAVTQSGTWNVTNISGTVSLPTGASTAAKQPALGTAGTASADVITVQGIASMTALKVDGSAVTQPVSGTFWQATQPVSAASLPLPSGASTAAKQPALGTAGTASSDVITVQGITSMTALKVDGSAVTQPVSLAATVTVTGAGGTFPVTDSGGSLTVDNNGTFAVQVDGAALTSLQLIDDVVFAEDAASASGDKGVLALAVRRDSVGSTTSTDGDYSTLTVDSNSRLYVNVSNTVNAAQSGSWSVAQSGTWNIATVSGLTAMNGQNISMGTGTRDAGTQRVTIATNDIVPASQSGTWTVQPGNTANTTPWLTTPTPATSGGLSLYSVNSSGATNQDAAAIKASAGQIFGYALFNTTASARYVKLYNLASGATSASTPILRAYLPPAGGANVDIPMGIACGTGISIRLTTGAADSDTGACSANDVLANVWYK